MNTFSNNLSQSLLFYAPILILSLVNPALSEAGPANSFGLGTMFVEEENLCLDANPGGTAQQKPCDYIETQYWQALPAAVGRYFQLTTEVTPGLCLQAQRGAESQQGGGGGAAMVNCADDAAQKWLFIESGVEYHYLLKNFAGGDAACLEGNRVAPGALLEGAAFLDVCSNVSGQFWRIGGAVPVNGIPEPLED